jgi:DnaJ-class molecular chaperone
MIKRFEDLSYYELLKIPVNASSFEIRQAYKKILCIYEESSLATYSLFSEDERRAILAKIESAFLTLIDNKKRDTYDNKLVNSGEVSTNILVEKGQKKAIPIFQINKARTRTSNPSRIRNKIQEKAAKELSGAMLKGEIISGRDLKNLRESLDIELEEVFQATKISPTALEAIEQDDIGNLPPTIYLKSFLKSYADLLQLDAKKIVEGYLKNIEKS